MKQPEDCKTLELPLEVKRGRGRPAKVDALSPAERARRYREKRKAAGIKRDMPTKTFIEMSSKLNLAESKEKAANESAKQWLDELKEAERKIKALENEQRLLMLERKFAWAEIEKLKSDASR